MPLEPRYTHDCKNCKFIGQLGDLDIYRCPQMGVPTIVGRYGNQIEQYTSGQTLYLHEIGLKLSLYTASEHGWITDRL